MMHRKTEFDFDKGQGPSIDETAACNTDSIAKGVFAFKRSEAKVCDDSPAKRRRSFKSQKKRKSAAGPHSDAFDYFGRSSSCDDESLRTMRWEAYSRIWTRVSQRLQKMQRQVFEKVLMDVIAFSKANGKTNTEEMVATCALVAGVNLPDHENLFRLLTRQLHTEVSKHVASVKSNECNTLKNMVKRVVSQLTDPACNNNNAQDDEFNDKSFSEEEEEEDDDDISKPCIVQPSLPNLKTWYNNQYPAGNTTKQHHKKPPVIVIIEDFEGFQPQMMQDFIFNISQYTSDLPLVLILGLATTVSAIHRSLPHSATSHLAIDSFCATPSIHLLAKFVEALIMDGTIPFKLGGGVLKTLLETFSFHDLSVQHFLMAFKFCLLEHFSKNVASALCPRANRAEALAQKDLLQDLQKLPSFRQFVSADPKQHAGLLINPEAFKKLLLEKLTELDQKTRLFNIFVSCLHAVVEDLPRQPLGKNLHHVYNMAVMEPVTQSHEYREAFQYLRFFERNGLISTLKVFKNALKQDINKDAAEVTSVYEETQALLQQLYDLGQQVPSSSTDSNKNVDQLKVSTTEVKSPKLDRFKLQEALLVQAREKKAKSLNPYEAVREKVLDFLHKTFDQQLAERPCQWLFHEVCYFDDEAAVKEKLIGAPRNAVQAALKYPNHYIEHPSLFVASEGEIPPTLPDIGIAYKLHLECGRLINLFDWLQCWLSIVGTNNDENSSPQKKPRKTLAVPNKRSKKGQQKEEEEEVEEEDNQQKVVDEKLHARFSRAVSELQFLGFIRPSRRKTDHVERLTF